MTTQEFAPFIEDEDGESFSEYIARMRSDGEWAGQPELQAVAQVTTMRLRLPPRRRQGARPLQAPLKKSRSGKPW